MTRTKWQALTVETIEKGLHVERLFGEFPTYEQAIGAVKQETRFGIRFVLQGDRGR